MLKLLCKQKKTIGEDMSYNAFIKQETYGTGSGNKAMSSTIGECDQHGIGIGVINFGFYRLLNTL